MAKKRTRQPEATKATVVGASDAAETKAKKPKNTTTAAPTRKAKPSSLIDTRVVYCGDCLEQLQNLPDDCIDLIYIDPPFNSNRNYEVFWGETKEKRAFEDRHASTQAYIDYMRPRCVELSRVLKKTGSFYYHCDWHASHYVKVMLDQIFGQNNFQNEIVWQRTTNTGSSKAIARKFSADHDVVFYYVGSPKYTFNKQYRPYSEKYIKHYYIYDDGDGRGCYQVQALKTYSQSRYEQLQKDGRIVPGKGKILRFKDYLAGKKGVPVNTIWTDIEPVNPIGGEKLGYPTQKPISLLDRIIKTSSNENDIVLDAFCGCGTALASAQNLGRQWIGIDISPTACRVMAKRLRDVCNMHESEPLWKAHKTNAYVVRDLPWTIQKLKALPHFEFENWAVIALGGIPNKVQVGDMGIDGRIFPVGSKPDDSEDMFAHDWFPIQVKQSEKVGRPEIDKFEAVMERENRQRGFFVAFSYTQDSLRECAAFHKRSGRLIKLLTVQEILEEEHVQKM